MAKKSLRAQLNQIRSWVRQGRTDAWIAHQLEVPASELREFRRRHELTADGDDESDVDLRDEIEAEIEAATLTEDEEDEEADDEEADEEDDETDDAEDDEDEEDAPPSRGRARARGGGRGGDRDREDASGAPRRRRRRGRRGRGAGGGAGVGANDLQATFDHGEEEGYGLWLDPSIADDPVYSENWAGHRAVRVQVEADRIVIRRS